MLGNGRRFGSVPLSESSALTLCQKVRPKFGRTESSVYHYEFTYTYDLTHKLEEIGMLASNARYFLHCSITQKKRVTKKKQ